MNLGKFQMIKIVLFAFLVAPALTGCGLLIEDTYIMRGYQGRVIDIDTREPLEGAVVNAVYFGGLPFLSGGGYYMVDGQEAVTDEKGNFFIPDTIVESTNPRGKLAGQLHIFKPGYGTLFHPRSKWTCREYPDRTKCPKPYNEFVLYELPQLADQKERKRNIPGLFRTIPYSKQKRLFEARQAERRNMDLNVVTEYPEDDHLTPRQLYDDKIFKKYNKSN